MGKKKIDNLRFVEDKHVRNITFHLRKRGLIKKCIELSCMCDLDVYLFIQDTKKRRVVEYKSNKDFDVHNIKPII